jgi:hypothetical protein
MKSVIIFFSLIVIIIILSMGIVDGLSALNNDMNNHLWLNLVGRWESRENGHYEIEFSLDGTFDEYYYGVRKGFGNYQVDGTSVFLQYDASNCTGDTDNSCTVTMQLYFEINTIVLVNNEKRMSFDKVSGK